MKVSSIMVCMIATISLYTKEVSARGGFNYSLVLHDSLLFYEAQRSGKLPANNRVKWRGDSMLNDGKDVGLDLTGGYFDAGDLVKFGFPMAYTMTVLAWGGVDYEAAYKAAGEWDNLLQAVKWGTDYFIKCHPDDNTFYGQVGNGNEDHAVWGRPEDWEKLNRPRRPAQKVTAAGGGADLVGETAAAMAAASILFKTFDPIYSDALLKHAQSLYAFASAHRVPYVRELPGAQAFYGSSDFTDELAWAAVWLLRATNSDQYKTEVNNLLNQYRNLANRPGGFDWGNKAAGVQVLLAQITGEERYMNMARLFCDNMSHGVPKSPKGLAIINDWGTLRHASNAAFICLHVAYKLNINSEDYQTFAENQLFYALGSTGRSFVIGFGVNPPTRPHHRPSSCPDPPAPCDYGTAYNNPGPNPQTLIGALVGGPDKNDNYNDSRADYVHNEVAMDYNAGFTSALAAYLSKK